MSVADSYIASSYIAEPNQPLLGVISVIHISLFEVDHRVDGPII